VKLLQWLVLGMPRRRNADADEAMAGRAQTGWGGWWDRHPLLLRLLALIAALWMATYIVWRFGWSWRGADPWLGGVLLISETFGLWNLVMLTWFSWKVPAAARPRTRTLRSIDVYVCTYDEPLTVVRSTLVGCAALKHPHTTYLLDDGRRPEMAELAAEWGADYIARADNHHAKAGNINSALKLTRGELVLMLDADHVPLPDALDALVGYFEDDRVALVQTPHDFYNHDSIQHYEVGRHEQSVFYSVICPGKDRHGAAFWCGSGALIRRQALVGIGGVATETIAEDFHTTIKLQRAGWRTRYHDEVLIQGLGPHDLASYLLQRDRWARGNLSVFTTPESPLRARELTAAQRLSYLASLSSYLAGPMRLLSLLILSVVLWTGQLPLHATPTVLATLWGPATILSIAAGTALCRGYQSLADTTHFELCTAEIYGRALRCALRPGRATFKVTPKEGVDHGGWESVRRLRAVLLLAVLLGVGLVLRSLVDAGVGPALLPRMHGVVLWLVPLITVFELRRVLRTLALVGERRQLRAEYRVPLRAPIAVIDPNGRGATIGHSLDLSPSGMRMELTGHLDPRTAVKALIQLPTNREGDSESVHLDLRVVTCRQAAGDGWIVGATIAGSSPGDRTRLLEYCYVVSAMQRLSDSTAPLARQILLSPVPAVRPTIAASEPHSAVTRKATARTA
jgi:cellulose synthase/poly-beta-1,6-N-acetylglucosamine synthase-like glycosyltransferase